MSLRSVGGEGIVLMLCLMESTTNTYITDKLGLICDIETFTASSKHVCNVNEP